MTDDDTDDVATAATMLVDIRKLSPDDLGRLGLQEIAYVKPVVVNGAHAFAIHAADGTPMALAQDRSLAVAAIVEHEMVAAQVH